VDQIGKEVLWKKKGEISRTKAAILIATGERTLEQYDTNQLNKKKKRYEKKEGR